jgi:phosphatidylcholine synthase
MLALVSSPVESPRPPHKVAFAWGVHAFTASGGVVGVAALLAAGGGDLRAAALLMLVALVIDSVDGTLARAARVTEVLPGIDGRRLDDIVDYLNYVIVPAVFLVSAGSLVHWTVAALPVLASAYGFAQTDAKTEDHFFVGFPSYWNVVALYLWVLGVSPLAGTLLVVCLSAAVFIPLKYVYPSRMSVLRRTTNGAAALWLATVTAALLFSEASWRKDVLTASLAFPLYYLALSFWLGGRQRREA